jgi:hypothetical protein
MGTCVCKLNLIKLDSKNLDKIKWERVWINGNTLFLDVYTFKTMLENNLTLSFTPGNIP